MPPDTLPLGGIKYLVPTILIRNAMPQSTLPPGDRKYSILTFSNSKRDTSRHAATRMHKILDPDVC